MCLTGWDVNAHPLAKDVEKIEYLPSFLNRKTTCGAAKSKINVSPKTVIGHAVLKGNAILKGNVGSRKELYAGVNGVLGDFNVNFMNADSCKAQEAILSEVITRDYLAFCVHENHYIVILVVNNPCSEFGRLLFCRQLVIFLQRASYLCAIFAPAKSKKKKVFGK